MGFNTVAVLFNDQTYAFRENSGIGPAIANAMTAGWSMRYRSRLATWFGAGQVISQAHADYYQVCVVGKNGGYSLCCDEEVPEDALDAVKSALEARGYTVRKKRSSPSSESKASPRRSVASA